MGFEDYTILIVDDSQASLALFTMYLGDFNFRRILTAEDGNAAISMIKMQQVDLILSDWDMPGMDGLALLKWVRCQEDTAQLPFIIMTARTDEADRLEAMKARVTDFIVKPFSPNALLDKLRNALSLKIALDTCF